MYHRGLLLMALLLVHSSLRFHKFVKLIRDQTLDDILTDETVCSSKTGNLSATLQLIPGTHHVKFIVDGEMQLSNDLPTAVDGTNVLVNYFEVSAEDGRPSSDDIDHRSEQDLPPQTEVKDHDPGSMGKTQPKEPEKPHRPVFWGNGIPFYLRDGDQPENSNRFRRAGRTVEDFPEPPSLPVVLSKSILNSTTPVKDDSSVLNMPNHTLLNHLATSSIKQDVLATSVTTRYKRKVCCWIIELSPCSLLTLSSMLQL